MRQKLLHVFSQMIVFHAESHVFCCIRHLAATVKSNGIIHFDKCADVLMRIAVCGFGAICDLRCLGIRAIQPLLAEIVKKAAHLFLIFCRNGINHPT